MARMRALEG
jgi:hypothetical protein